MDFKEVMFTHIDLIQMMFQLYSDHLGWITFYE
jgi:hypothetical protein